MVRPTGAVMSPRQLVEASGREHVVRRTRERRADRNPKSASLVKRGAGRRPQISRKIWKPTPTPSQSGCATFLRGILTLVRRASAKRYTRRTCHRELRQSRLVSVRGSRRTSTRSISCWSGMMNAAKSPRTPTDVGSAQRATGRDEVLRRQARAETAECPGRVIRGVTAGARRPAGKARRCDWFERGATRSEMRRRGMPRTTAVIRIASAGHLARASAHRADACGRALPFARGQTTTKTGTMKRNPRLTSVST